MQDQEQSKTEAQQTGSTLTRGENSPSANESTELARIEIGNKM